jgi:hypothetical protein
VPASASEPWASGFVVRVDTALSKEGAQVQMMISQPFRFL